MNLICKKFLLLVFFIFINGTNLKANVSNINDCYAPMELFQYKLLEKSQKDFVDFQINLINYTSSSLNSDNKTYTIGKSLPTNPCEIPFELDKPINGISIKGYFYPIASESRFVAYGIYKIIFTRIKDQKSFALIHSGHNSPVKASHCGCLNYVKEKKEEICYQYKWIEKNIKNCNFEKVNKITFKTSNIKSFPFGKLLDYKFLNTPFYFADLDFDNIEEIILVSGPNNAGFAQRSNVYVYNFVNNKSKFELYKEAPLILGEIKEIDFNTKRIISVGDFRSRSEVIYKFLENSIQIFHDGYTMNGMKSENFLKTYTWPYVY